MDRLLYLVIPGAVILWAALLYIAVWRETRWVDRGYLVWHNRIEVGKDEMRNV